MPIDPASNPTWARLANGRYRRHFAGRDRATRDVFLLDEIAADLERLVPQLVGSDQERAKKDLELCRSERPKILEAQKAGTKADQAQRLGGRANDQFSTYRHAFAGKERASRNADLLRRLIKSLHTILAEMDALAASGLTTGPNDKNRGIVRERVGMYEKELLAVEAARKDVGDNVRAHLAKAANTVFSSYREGFQGKDRKSCDPDKLHDLMEELFPIARTMSIIAAGGDDPVNDENLKKVLEHLDLYEREFQLIVQSRIEARAGLS